MSLNFLAAFATTKARAAAKDVTAALVAFDPKGATEAQIVLMERSLDELGSKIAVTQRQHGDAQKALDTALKLNTQRLTAAEALQVDPAKADSLAKLLGILETAQPELDGLKADEKDVSGYLTDLKAAYDSAATKLKSARRQLEDAQRGMARAEIAQDRARDKADAASIAAGIHSGGDTLNVALDAMNRKTQAAQDAASALNMKASTLTPEDVEKDDGAIAAAMREASGVAPPPSSATDRLAALKSRAA